MMEGKFSGEGLDGFEEDDDMVTSMVRELLKYQEVERYATPALRPRLVFVTDPVQALRTPDFVPELAVDAYSEFGALHFPVVSYSQFARDHSTFYVLAAGSPGEWLPQALVHDDFHKVSGSAKGISHYMR